MRRWHKGLAAVTFLGIALMGCSAPHDSSINGKRTGATLSAVRARGYISCGASQGTVGFSVPDAKGYWRGLDVDMCRAVAAAVFGDKDRARFVELTGAERIAALQTGQIDMIARTLTWTLLRDANGLSFTIPDYYDYFGVMVRRSSNIRQPSDLENDAICVQTGSTTEVRLEDVSRRRNLHLRAVLFDSIQGARQAFFSGRCDGIMSDGAALASLKATLGKSSNDYLIIPADDEVEALTPAVRHGDDQWFDIVKFSIAALFTAEELGITRENVDSMLNSKDPDIRRFLGVEKGNGKALGLREDFAYQIVKQLGNYAEIYDETLGNKSSLKIPRGLNRLERDGGIIVPIPFN